MKKIIIVLTFLLLTGCFAKPEAILKKAIEKNSNLNNYYADINMDVVIEKDGSSMTMGLKGNMKYDNKNQTAYSEMTTSFFGVSTTSKSYSMVKDGKDYTYTEEEKIWYKEEKSSTMDLKFDSLSNVTVLSEDKNEIVYEVKLTEEELKQILDFTNTGTSQDKMPTIDFNNVKVNMTVRDKDLTKVYIELPAILDGVNMKVQMTMEYSKFNEIGNITIPENIINGALDKKTIELKGFAEDYIEEAEYEVWGDEALENSVFTAVNLEYDGPKPSKVELTMKDGYVQEGVIELEGYRATVKDSEIISFELIK